MDAIFKQIKVVLRQHVIHVHVTFKIKSAVSRVHTTYRYGLQGLNCSGNKFMLLHYGQQVAFVAQQCS